MCKNKIANIKIRLTRQQNAAHYGVSVGDVVEIPLSDYLCGVVPAEIGSAYLESCRAQAVASRTYAYPYFSRGRVITDASSSHQAFVASLIGDPAHRLAHQAVLDTQGELLFYDGQVISPCAFSSCNRGVTTSSLQRWGGARPYLIEQLDPWDAASSSSSRLGHGVGMSQCGAKYAASIGMSYRDILSFYYPGTTLSKEGSPMGQVKASDLVRLFKKMAAENWKYVAGSHKQGAVDCSGAFYYAYNQLGGYMYHGSNTMYRKYTVFKGKIGEVDLVPGMAVFKRRAWSPSQSSNGWYGDSIGDVYHVGMYVGGDEVVEAKSAKCGVVTSKLSSWHFAAKLVDTQYDLSSDAQAQLPASDFMSSLGVVSLSSGYLNVRKSADASSARVGKLYDGDVVTVVGEADDWYAILFGGATAYVKKNYLSLSPADKQPYTLRIVVFGEEERDRMVGEIKSYGFSPVVTEGGESL